MNNIEFAVLISGYGTALVWGHGMMANMAAEEQAPWFAWDRLGDAATVIRYDARGHGQSGASADPRDYTWTRLALDMLGIADQLNLEHFVAGGASLGCATALYAALAAPQRIAGLILATPPSAWEMRRTQAAAYGQMAAQVEAHGTAALAMMMTQRSQSPIPRLIQEVSPKALNEMGARLKEYDATTLANVLRGAERSDLPPRQQIQSIAAPSLILAWEGDPGHPVATAQELRALLPNAEAHIAGTITDLETWPDRMRTFLVSLRGS